MTRCRAMSIASSAELAFGILARRWLVNSKCSRDGGCRAGSAVGVRDADVRFRRTEAGVAKSSACTGRDAAALVRDRWVGAGPIFAKGSGELGGNTGLLGTMMGQVSMVSLDGSGWSMAGVVGDRR